MRISTESRKVSQEESVVPSYIIQLLRPLEEPDSIARNSNVPSDYKLQQKELLEMDHRIRGGEALFAEAYSQVTALEKAIASYQEKWQNRSLAS